MRKSATAAVVTMALLWPSALAQAQQALPPINVLKGNSTGPDDSFGASIASYREENAPFREWLFVGAPTERSSRGLRDGAVYVFRRQNATYQFVQKLQQAPFSAGNDGDRFGDGVVAKRGYLLIATPNFQWVDDGPFPTGLQDRPATDNNPPFWFSGRVHVYRFNPVTSKWVEVQAFPSNIPRREGRFGARPLSSHMAISNDGQVLAIGEPDTYDATSAQRLGISRLQVYRHWVNGSFEWCCSQSIDIASDDATTDTFAGDSVVALPGQRFAIDVHVRKLDAQFSANATSSHGEIWVYGRGGDRFGDILARTPVQKIVGKEYAAGACTNVNEQPGRLSRAGFEGMAATGDYFAAAAPCADGAAGLRAGRLDIYTVAPSGPPLQLVNSFEGATADAWLGSSISGGQESVAFDQDGCRILAGAALKGGDVHFYTRIGASWGPQARLTLASALPRTWFGQAVNFPAANHAIVGKITALPAPSRGAAFVYAVPRCGSPRPPRTGNFDVTNQAHQEFAAWAQAPNVKIVAGDFDSDAKIDDIALVGGAGWTTIPVAFGQGNGAFTITNRNVATFPGLAQAANTKIVAGDFDQASFRNDIAMVGGAGWNQIHVARGEGGGNFTPISHTAGSFPAAAQDANTKIVAGDFDGDGRIDDIAMVGGAASTIRVAYKEGIAFLTGNFSVTSQFVAEFPGWAQEPNTKIVSGDFDGDGRVDDIAMVGGATWTTIPIAYGQAGGNFTITNHTVADFPIWAQAPNTKIVSGDFDGDMRIDDIAMVGGTSSTTIRIAYGLGDGRFTVTDRTVASFPALAQDPNAKIVSADFDNSFAINDIAMVGGANWTTIPVATSVGQ